MNQAQSQKQRSIGIGLLFLFYFLFVSTAQAQIAPDLVDVSITMIPTNPGPGATVTLMAQSFSADLSQASLSWNYGGKTVASGIGKTKVAVTAPGAGAIATATVTVTGIGTSPASASILLNPASVDMLWEAVDTYTPPFYKGKATLSVGGIFRVSAIPAASAPRQATFSWTRNGSALQSASGLNQSSLILENTIFNKQEGIAVNVHGGTFQGNGNVAINTSVPALVAYQQKEGFTDYAHGTTTNIAVSGPGTTLRFEPYYFSTPAGLNRSLTFALKTDGQPVYGDTAPNELRISRPEDGSTHTVTVSANTSEYSLQNVTRTFNLLFN